jgi:uncharacterized repeat protein (TIGR01451 family)
MGALRVRWAAAVAVTAGLAATAIFGLATPASGATSAEAELSTLPGLDAVTYGQVAAYSARIENTGTATLKAVTLRNPIPTTLVDGQPQQATFESAGCTGILTATEFSCVVTDRLRPGESAAVTIAWRTPAAGSSPGCPSGGPCMTNSAFWQASARTFAMDPASTALLDQDDPSKAATYATAACTDTSSPTLATDPDVGPGNPLATSVCAPSLPPSAPGLVTSIEERDAEESDPGITQVSEICLPSPGTECDAAPFVFSPLATFTFVISNATLPVGDEIDTVYHDGQVVSTNRRADPHVVIIKNERFKGITLVVVRSSTNGQWSFG